MYRLFKPTFPVIILLLLGFLSCKNKAFKKDDLVNNVFEMNDKIKTNIENIIITAGTGERLEDSTRLGYYNVIKYLYQQNANGAFWSNNEKWKEHTSILLNYLDTAERNGLYKEDYHYTYLKQIKQILETDSVKKINAVMWAYADIIFSDAFVALLKDLKQGRLLKDSSSFKYDTSRYNSFFKFNFTKLKNGQVINELLKEVEPTHKEYWRLKKALKPFVESMDKKDYAYLDYPAKDTVAFINLFEKRMREEVSLSTDSNKLVDLIKKYQVLKALKVDGKIGKNLIDKLNLTDKAKFNRIAITLDKYKLLPEIMPEKYVWVNLPSFYLKVFSADTIVFISKIICGKPTTPTPHITSAISNMVLYPTWTVPTSIIKKDMLPALKRNADYLSRKGLYLLNGKGEHVDASTINWTNYTNGIPFLIQQGSGDDNALGVIKFNFENPYSVYLHDTNQRYLFKNAVRSLSHGCVRVQDWQKLASFIIRNDSMNWKKNEVMSYNTDSIKTWIIRKEKHTVIVKNKIPLFIRYFSCENVNGSIKFYDDIYGEDRALNKEFFAAK